MSPFALLSIIGCGSLGRLALLVIAVGGTGTLASVAEPTSIRELLASFSLSFYDQITSGLFPTKMVASREGKGEAK